MGSVNGTAEYLYHWHLPVLVVLLVVVLLNSKTSLFSGNDVDIFLLGPDMNSSWTSCPVMGVGRAKPGSESDRTDIYRSRVEV